MPVALLQDWCRGEHLALQRAMLVLGIPEDCGQEELQETLQAALRPLGKYRVVGRMFRREENAQAFLLELERDINYVLAPREIPARGGAWEVIVKPRNTDSEFFSRLKCFLEEERRSVADMNRVLGSHPTCPATGLPVSSAFWAWAQTLGAVVQPLLEQMLYRELRVFSGHMMSMPGALAFEVWLEHTTHVLQMWQVPEEEKRQRLMECLRGPALQVVSSLRANNPAVSVAECLQALQRVFGPLESRRVTQVKFHKARQELGEKVSSFVVRLEPLLQKAVEKNAVSRKNVNQARLNQVLDGATLPDKLRERLRLMKQRRRAPGFLALVQLLREEEEWEAAMGHERHEELVRLRDISQGRPTPISQHHGGRGGGRRQRRRRGGPVCADSLGPEEQRRHTFCYGCGEDGHLRAQCTNPQNLALVKQKREATLELGNGYWAWDQGHPKPKPK
ncbi:paraneoplastic antigen Ma3 [Echinops telfairi]|uniref:Paraneoplastic antigen Ma3 n=1 Tax=Echinops telfairi TaxID=9371 RepID=A0ABM0J646_ECHTE|nr:paraneoplastic antigen Ma3 [Echinops telfairi]